MSIDKENLAKLSKMVEDGVQLLRDAKQFAEDNNIPFNFTDVISGAKLVPSDEPDDYHDSEYEDYYDSGCSYDEYYDSSC